MLGPQRLLLLSTALMTGEKEDPRTVQDMLRHSKVATSLELYTQSTMQQRIAAQEKYLRRILPQSELVNVNGTKNGTGFCLASTGNGESVLPLR